MTRQLDVAAEVRESKRREALIRALEYGIVGALEHQGIELRGLSIKYSAFDCLMTVRADVNGVPSVSFIGSDSMMNCFLKLESGALRMALHWREDAYRK